ncbi:hypothetical protein Tco_0831858 [Tanacetum coccineum]
MERARTQVREYVLAKPHHSEAPGGALSRNSTRIDGSNDMAHNHYLEESRKKTQERNRNQKPRVGKPTGKMYHTDSTTKVDSEPPNGSNDDITNPYECNQTLNVSAGTLNLSAVQASVLNVNKMTSVHISSGPAPQTIKCVSADISLRAHKVPRSSNVLPSSNGHMVIMAPVQSSPGPAHNLLTPGPISSGLVPNSAPATPYVPPTNKELEMLFQPMFDEYFNPPGTRQDHIPNVAQDPVIPTGPSVSIAIDLDAPSGSHTSSPLDHHSSSVHHGVAGEQYAEVNPFAADDHAPFVNVFALEYHSEASSSGEITIPDSNQSTLPHEHIRKWTNSYPLDNIIGNPSRPLLKTVGFKPCKKKFMNLIDWTYGN